MKSEGMLRLLSLRQDWYLTDQVLVSHSWEDPILGLTRGQEKSGSFKHLKPMNKLRFRHISHVKRVVSDSDMNLDSTSGKKTKALGKTLFTRFKNPIFPSQPIPPVSSLFPSKSVNLSIFYHNFQSQLRTGGEIVSNTRRDPKHKITDSANGNLAENYSGI